MEDLAFHRQRAHPEFFGDVMSGKETWNVIFHLNDHHGTVVSLFLECYAFSQDELSSRFRQEGYEDLY